MQRVSVVIPTRKPAVMLREAIESILVPRSADIELEVIICRNQQLGKHRIFEENTCHVAPESEADRLECAR
jgi:hypothetical protein